jgi:hypothetical protein
MNAQERLLLNIYNELQELKRGITMPDNGAAVPKRTELKDMAISEVAAKLGRGVTWVINRIKDKSLKARKYPDGKYRVTMQAVEEFLAEAELRASLGRVRTPKVQRAPNALELRIKEIVRNNTVQ